MPSVKALGLRLKSVTSTSKITKAMKMVAASKLRQAEANMKAARPFAASVQDFLMEHITPSADSKPTTQTTIAISSDKGLCGGINSRVVKELKLSLDRAKVDQIETNMLIVGSKARDGLVRTHSKMITTGYDEVYQGPVTFSLASYLAEEMLAKPADNYNIVYNKFKSVISFDVCTLSLEGPTALLEGEGVMDEYEFEGNKEDVLADMYQFNLACSLYGSLMENITSEQASRMTAMDSASTNATEMIARLQLQYNRLRQAKITTELTEIVAGAESV